MSKKQKTPFQRVTTQDTWKAYRTVNMDRYTRILTDNIRLYMTTLGLSRTDMAMILGIDPRNLSQWLVGTARPSLKKVSWLEDLLGFDNILTPQTEESVRAIPRDRLAETIKRQAEEDIKKINEATVEKLNSIKRL